MASLTEVEWCQASLSTTNSLSLLKLMSIESVMSSNHLILCHQWCHPTISSSDTHFSSCLQSFPESGSFPVSQLFASGGQSIGVSDSVSILPVNIKDWFPVLRGQGSQPHIKGKVHSEPGFLFLMPSLTSPLTVRVQLIHSLASRREEQKENPPVGSSAFSPNFLRWTPFRMA